MNPPRNQRVRVVTVVGTRPEGIKMAPVIRALRRRRGIFEALFVSTAQHRELLDVVLQTFGLKPDIDLRLMQPNQGLAQFAGRALVRLSRLFRELAPDVVLVQGDTTTAAVAGLAAFYEGVKVGHVEAGLRSGDRHQPYPEEINRRIAGVVADWHFAPTPRARANLLREGVAARSVFVTGNTIVDALQAIPVNGPFDNPALRGVDFQKHRVLLVTAHRRENHGAPLRSICDTLRSLTAQVEDVEVVYPVHLNPAVRQPVRRALGALARVRLTEPLSYRDLLRVLHRCHLVLTDSGGIQEEAPSFHKPVLVLREVTERPEAVEAGGARLVGTDARRILRETRRLLTDPAVYRAMSTRRNPFGDGRAAERIVRILTRVTCRR